MTIYAGVGARKTPENVLLQMRNLAAAFGGNGFVLRSGGAGGADISFETGCDTSNGQKEIFTVDSGADTERKAWSDIARDFHPAWNRCGEYARRLHARNTPIVLGCDLLSPVDFVVCWTVGGTMTGGTGQALRIADFHNIPIYNLFFKDNYEMLMEWQNQ